MTGIVYCIECEREVEVQVGTLGEIHEHNYRTEFGFYEYDWCEFPMGYTHCPPPEMEEDWEEHLEEVEDMPVEECEYFSFYSPD